MNIQTFIKLFIQKVSDKIGLNKDLPYVDIQERIKNKSFVAEKAVLIQKNKESQIEHLLQKLKSIIFQAIRQPKL